MSTPVPTYWRNLSHFGRFRVSGKDAAQLLHHLTTNNIKKLKDGEGCDAILITNKARVLDWLTIWRDGEAYEVLTSPNRRNIFVPHAQKFILFRQDVHFQDVTENGVLHGLFGDVSEVLTTWNAASILDAPLNTRQQIEVKGAMLRVSRTRRLPGEGVLIECHDHDAMQRLIGSTSIPLCDNETYNSLRIEAGIPATGLELTEDINPWEANLDFAVSLDKGCYNGQEVIARLHTYKKVKQKLMGLRLQKELSMEEVTTGKILLRCNGRDAGFLTSSTLSSRVGPIALGYLRGDFQEAGTTVEVLASAPPHATVCPVPFN